MAMTDRLKGKPYDLRRVTVWRALLNGDCKQIHKSEHQLWEELTLRNFWYQESDKTGWTVETREEEFPVVNGEAHDWGAEGGEGGVHIHWDCPYCGETHYTDDDPHDRQPYLWFCERGRGIALVAVAQPL